MRVSLLLLLAACTASALQLPGTSRTSTRRQALQRFAASTAAATAPIFASQQPAQAKSKSSLMPNKPEGVGANAGSYLRDQYKAEYQAMAGDKGSRGVASKEFEKRDSVVANRKANGGLARDASGRKIVKADRTRDPAELGLKQWDGN